MFTYLKNHNPSSIVSLMYRKKPVYDVTNKKSIITNQLISMMTNRPLECTLDSKKIMIAYVDYLCVHNKYRKQGNAPKNIFTHYVKFRNEEKNINVMLFKRESNMTAYVPLTTYYTYGFHIKNWKYTMPTYGNITNILINSQTLDIFFHFFKNMQQHFRCFMSPSLSNLQELVEKELLFIFVLLKNDCPIACYIFRNPYTFYHTSYGNKPSIDCIASYLHDKILDQQIFIDFFYHSVIQIGKKHPFEFLIIENISDNNFIIQNIFKKNKPIIKAPTAYYFYNFAYRPILSTNIFLLN